MIWTLNYNLLASVQSNAMQCNLHASHYWNTWYSVCVQASGCDFLETTCTVYVLTQKKKWSWGCPLTVVHLIILWCVCVCVCVCTCVCPPAVEFISVVESFLVKSYWDFKFIVSWSLKFLHTLNPVPHMCMYTYKHPAMSHIHLYGKFKFDACNQSQTEDNQHEFSWY